MAATELVAAVPPAGGRCGAGRGVHGCTLVAAGVGVPAGAVLREQRCAGEGASRHVARAEPEWGDLRGGQVPPLRAATDRGPVQAPGRRRVLREPVDATAAAVAPDISGRSGSTNQAESPQGPPASSEDAPASGTPRTAVRQGTRAQRRAGPNSVCRRKPRSGKRLRLGQTLEGCSVNTCGLTEKRSKWRLVTLSNVRKCHKAWVKSEKCHRSFPWWCGGASALPGSSSFSSSNVVVLVLNVSKNQISLARETALLSVH